MGGWGGGWRVVGERVGGCERGVYILNKTLNLIVTDFILTW